MVIFINLPHSHIFLRGHRNKQSPGVHGWGGGVVVVSEPAGSIATKLCGLMTYAVLFSLFFVKI